LELLQIIHAGFRLASPRLASETAMSWIRDGIASGLLVDVGRPPHTAQGRVTRAGLHMHMAVTGGRLRGEKLHEASGGRSSS